ncbi:MAG: response regulator, partial [Nitrospirae bacterium]|nr:response regulator [Nitrospirota bacterium]
EDRKDKKRILIVDDEEDQVDVMQCLFKDRYTTVGVNSGKEAIERLTAEVYDLIVCDVKMPGIDGAGVYDWVRGNRPSMANRMLFSTGDTLGPRAEKIISRIGDHYIIKPYNADELLRKVADILAQDEHLHNP